MAVLGLAYANTAEEMDKILSNRRPNNEETPSETFKNSSILS